MKIGGLWNYQLHDIISILLIRYKKTTDFVKLNLYAKETRLLAVSQNKIAQTPGRIILACKEILNKFATLTYLRNSIDEIKFPIVLKQHLAKRAIWITSIEELYKELSLLYILKFSIPYKWVNILVVKLAESIQTPNENNNSAYHIPLKVCNNNSSPNIIRLKTINGHQNSKSIVRE